MINTDTPSAEKHSENKEQIFAEQVRLLFDSTLLGCIIQAIVIITLVLAQKDFTTPNRIAVILAIFAIVVIMRAGLNCCYQNASPPPAEARKWAAYYTFAMAFNGLGWMIAAGIFITTSDAMNVIFTALILGGISSGALVSMATHLPTYYSFLFPTMLSGIVLYTQVGTDISHYTAVLGFLLMAFLFVSARRLNRILVANISMKIEYQFLFNNLVQEKKTTDLLNETLKTEIEERCSAEEKSRHALVQAEQASQAKSEFLSVMSHQLRTPLNAIMGYGQLLENQANSPKQVKYIEEILRGGRHLLTLINQVLDLAKIEKDDMEIVIAPTSAEDIINDAIAMLRSHAQQKHVELKFTPPATRLPLMAVDQSRVLQIVLNILSNAIKYNIPEGQVTVAVEEITAQIKQTAPASFIRITITDTGLGIPAEFHRQIFEPFNHLTHQSNKIEGAGIGLNICKNLVEIMAGEIGFESSEGEGSRFYVALPVAIASTEIEAETAINYCRVKIAG